MWLTVLPIACACVLSISLIYLNDAEQRSREANAVQKKKKPKFDRDMQEAEYVPLIPKGELKLVRQLIKRICTSRGWGAAQVEFDAAWDKALRASRSEEGGCWPDFFEAAHLNPANLQKLLLVLDETFLGGLLRGHVTHQQGTCGNSLGFCIDDDPGGPADWISYFGDDNTIHLLRSKWSQRVCDAMPISCEGVLCSTRLQLLAHTVAHEMVHAIVFNFFPEIDRSSQAYLPDEQHGPIFKLINKRLFGHSIDSYKHVFSIPSSDTTFDVEGNEVAQGISFASGSAPK